MYIKYVCKFRLNSTPRTKYFFFFSFFITFFLKVKRERMKTHTPEYQIHTEWIIDWMFGIWISGKNHLLFKESLYFFFGFWLCYVSCMFLSSWIEAVEYSRDLLRFLSTIYVLFLLIFFQIIFVSLYRIW